MSKKSWLCTHRRWEAVCARWRSCILAAAPHVLNDAQLTRLMAAIRQHFHLVTGGEFSIEIDPRKVTADTVRLLAELGFNRMSVGGAGF